MRNKFGFSLIELMVVVGIILVLTGIGSYSINRFIQVNKIIELRDYLSSRIKLAKNLSITNQLPDESVNLSFVKVTISSDNELIVEGIKKDEDGGLNGTTEPPYFSVDLEVNEGTTIVLTNNSNVVRSFGFSSKNGRLTDGDGNFSDGPLVVKLTNESEECGLTISELGIINNDD